MLQYLIDALKGLEAAVPPPDGSHHAITYAQYGSDKAGWRDQLILQVNKDNRFHLFMLSDDDFNNAAALIDEVKRQLSEPDPPNTQYGTGFAKYAGGAK